VEVTEVEPGLGEEPIEEAGPVLQLAPTPACWPARAATPNWPH